MQIIDETFYNAKFWEKRIEILDGKRGLPYTNALVLCDLP